MTRLETRHRCNVRDDIDHTVGEAPLVIIPRDQFAEPAVEHDACRRIKHARRIVMYKVCRHYRLICILDQDLDLAFCDHIHGRFDFVIRRLRCQSHGQVEDRHVRRRHTERHACELFIQLLDELLDSFCSAG